MSFPLIRFAALVLALVVVSCASVLGSRSEEVPTTIDSSDGWIPIVQVEFHATDSGYTLVRVRRSPGEPTLAFDPDGDVLITARSSDGGPLASISVSNPRQAYVDDGPPPHEFVLDEADLSVRLARPEAIHQIELFVRRGPNEGFRHVYPID